jgi:hypothetical protein
MVVQSQACSSPRPLRAVAGSSHEKRPLGPRSERPSRHLLGDFAVRARGEISGVPHRPAQRHTTGLAADAGQTGRSQGCPAASRHTHGFSADLPSAAASSKKHAAAESACGLSLVTHDGRRAKEAAARRKQLCAICAAGQLSQGVGAQRRPASVLPRSAGYDLLAAPLPFPHLHTPPWPRPDPRRRRPLSLCARRPCLRRTHRCAGPTSTTSRRSTA